MKIIDFDEKFNEYMDRWVERNIDRFQSDEEMEEAFPEVYEEWLHMPAFWLDGACPGDWFAEMDAAALCDALKEYAAAKVPVPDPLLDRLLETGDEAVLLALLRDVSAPADARLCAVELLRQMESSAPMVDYIRWQVERKEDQTLLDAALDCLREMGEGAVKPAKIAFHAADDAGKEALLDLLADYPGDQEVFSFALEQFKTVKEKRALFAGYLAKLDDDHALEALLDVAEGDDVSYPDFLEIRSAIERLGSEAPVRDWSGDESYIAFRKLQKSQMPSRKPEKH